MNNRKSKLFCGKLLTVTHSGNNLQIRIIFIFYYSPLPGPSCAVRLKIDFEYVGTTFY